MRQWRWLVPCVVLVGAGGVALYLAGFKEIVFYSVLLICPLLHLAMMGGHGHDTSRNDGKNDKKH